MNRSRKNEITIQGDIAVVHMTRGKSAIIDISDLPLISRYRWTTIQNKGQFYAHRMEGREQIYMHRFLVGAKKGEQVDHVDRNGLNNRRKNLRLATRSQNGRNRILPRGISGYRGVTWMKARKKWRADIKIEGKTKYLGSFTDAREAAKAYDRAAFAHDGECAIMNFPYQPESKNT